jgi:signal transduction histidine kinase
MASASHALRRPAGKCAYRIGVQYLVLILTLHLGTPAVNAAELQRVLLLHSFGPDYSPWGETATSFRAELFERSPRPVDLYEASIFTARFEKPQEEAPLIEYLRALFSEHKLDLMVAIGGPAVGFAQRHRSSLFPSTPMLMTGVADQRVAKDALTANDTTVGLALDLREYIRNILRLRPDTTNIAVVIGNSPLEQYWLKDLQREYQTFDNRVNFTWFNDLSFAEVLHRSANLPPNSSIFYFLFTVDADGVPHVQGQTLAALREVANAPIFGFGDYELGHGIVGGPLNPTESLGQQAAGVAVRILNGTPPGDIRTLPMGFGVSMYDGRELNRWNINEKLLPSGSIVRFRPPSAWELYRAQILTVCAILLVQAGLIGWLLYERERRRRSEAAAYDLSGRLINAQEDERSRLARELHDDVTQRLALLAIEADRGERGLPAIGGGDAKRALRDGLARLSEDVHALSYRLHSSILEDLGLIEALKAECETFSQRESVRVDVKAPEIAENLPSDVSLNLFRVAQEALRNVGRHAHAKAVEVSLRRVDGGVQLAVRDDGIGFDPAVRHDRPSRGHAGMRQRARLIGGELDIDSTPGHGTTVVAWVPLKEQRDDPRAGAAG